jgi:hypothetical protein
VLASPTTGTANGAADASARDTSAPRARGALTERTRHAIAKLAKRDARRVGSTGTAFSLSWSDNRPITLSSRMLLRTVECLGRVDRRIGIAVLGIGGQRA